MERREAQRWAGRQRREGRRERDGRERKMRRRGRTTAGGERANANPPRSAPCANRMATAATPTRALSPEAGPAVRRAVLCRLAPYRQCLSLLGLATTATACSLPRPGGESPTRNGRMALAVSRTAHPHASHMDGRAVCPRAPCVSSINQFPLRNFCASPAREFSWLPAGLPETRAQ